MFSLRAILSSFCVLFMLAALFSRPTWNARSLKTTAVRSIMTHPPPLKPYVPEGADPSISAVRKRISEKVLGPAAKYSSTAYDKFPYPIGSVTPHGFDAHVYFHQDDPAEVKFATELHMRIKLEFPEIPIYDMVPYPVGPHPIAMFEAHIHTPKQFGAFVSWLVIHRGPLPVLVHPNTSHDVNEMVADHIDRATWLGTPLPLDKTIFDRFR